MAIYDLLFHSWQTIIIWSFAFVLGILSYVSGNELDFKYPKHHKLQTLMRLMFVTDIAFCFFTSWGLKLGYISNFITSIITVIVFMLLGAWLSAIVFWVFDLNR